MTLPGTDKSLNQYNVIMLKLTKSKDVKYTMRILARITNLLLARVRGILKKNLKLRKINARWIPHLLSEQLLRTKESPC